MRVLMIDDDEDTNMLVGMLLQKSPFVEEHQIMTDGHVALNIIQKQEFEPDCIFVDVTMPAMGGYEFVEKFEQTFGNNLPTTCIYMLSSSARESDRKKIHEYSTVKEFILKPLTKKKLNDIAAEVNTSEVR